MHFQKGDLEKAKDYHERALEIRKEQKVQTMHVDVALCYNKLARLCDDIAELEHSGTGVFC